MDSNHEVTFCSRLSRAARYHKRRYQKPKVDANMQLELTRSLLCPMFEPLSDYIGLYRPATLATFRRMLILSLAYLVGAPIPPPDHP